MDYRKLDRNLLYQLIQCNKPFINGTIQHELLGYPYDSFLDQVTHTLKQTITLNSNLKIYGVYQLCKAHRLPFSHTHARSISPFIIIHLDLQILTLVTSIHRMKYFLLLANDCTIFHSIYVLSNGLKLFTFSYTSNFYIQII